MNDMSKVPAEGGAGKGAQLLAELEERTAQFQGTLPAHIPVERFKRVILTAINQNPALARADRRSFWNSATRAANDGLLPDGREGALVIYKTKIKDKATGKETWVDAVQWMPMIAGIRKKVRNSGEIKDWNAHVVHAKDAFEFELGDSPFVRHKPYIGDGDPGPVIAAYSVAHFKTGEISREVMARSEIDKIRSISKSKDGPAWTVWFEEMSRKAVARRHSKVLPMSTDLDDLMRRDDALYDMEGSSDKALSAAPPAKKISKLGDRLDQLAAPDNDGPEIDGEVVDGQASDNQDQQNTDERDPTRDSSASGQGEATQQPAGKDAGSPTSSQGEPASQKDAKPKGEKQEKAAPANKQANATVQTAAQDPGKQEAYAADLKAEGDRRAALGTDDLQEFLDGLEGDDQPLINAHVIGWQKTARNADAKAKGAT